MLERFQKATETHGRNKNFQFWQLENHAIEIYSVDFLWTKLDYIHLNPVRAGIVKKASQYLYSSACNYVYNKGLIEVFLANNPIVDGHQTNTIFKRHDF